MELHEVLRTLRKSSGWKFYVSVRCSFRQAANSISEKSQKYVNNRQLTLTFQNTVINETLFCFFFSKINPPTIWFCLKKLDYYYYIIVTIII